MLTWLRNLFHAPDLHEQIGLVKAEAARRELFAKNANAAYMQLAVDLGHKEAANFFLSRLIDDLCRRQLDLFP